MLDGRLALKFARASDRVQLTLSILAEGRRYDPYAVPTELRYNGVLIHREDAEDAPADAVRNAKVIRIRDEAFAVDPNVVPFSVDPAAIFPPNYGFPTKSGR